MNANIYTIIFLFLTTRNKTPTRWSLLRRCSEGLARRWQAVGDVPWRRSGAEKICGI